MEYYVWSHWACTWAPTCIGSSPQSSQTQKGVFKSQAYSCGVGFTTTFEAYAEGVYLACIIKLYSNASLHRYFNMSPNKCLTLVDPLWLMQYPSLTSLKSIWSRCLEILTSPSLYVLLLRGHVLFWISIIQKLMIQRCTKFAWVCPSFYVIPFVYSLINSATSEVQTEVLCRCRMGNWLDWNGMTASSQWMGGAIQTQDWCFLPCWS